MRNPTLDSPRGGEADCRQDLADSVRSRSSYASIIALALPQMIMMFFHFFIGFVDVYVAGLLGTDIQASLGMITQCLMFFQLFAMAVGNASVAAIGQSLGACLPYRARRYVGLSLLLVVGLSAVIMLAGFMFQETLLGTLLRVPASIRPVTDYFFPVALLTVPAYSVLIGSNAVFRAYRSVNIPLFAIVLVAVLNAVGDFGLGLGWWGLPRLGMKGLIWSTFFSLLAGALLNLYVLRRRRLLTLQAVPPWRWCRVAVRYLYKVAWPAGGMNLLWHTAYLVLFSITATLPTDAVAALAGMTAGLRIEAILFLPGFAFNLTAAIVVGHALGAGQPEEARRAGLKILMLGCVVIGAFGLLLWTQVGPVAELLSADPRVRHHTMQYLYYNILGIPFTVATMVLSGIMSGAGATVYNLFLFGTSAWLIRLPLAWFLGHLWWRDADGVWAAMLVSQVLLSLALLYMFLYRDWSRFTLKKSA